MASKFNINKEKILEEYDSGVTPANLAVKHGVHATTIRRWVRDSRKTNYTFSHTVNMDKDVKTQLRSILSKINSNNLDTTISKLDQTFVIEPRQSEDDVDFPVIILK